MASSEQDISMLTKVTQYSPSCSTEDKTPHKAKSLITPSFSGSMEALAPQVSSEISFNWAPSDSPLPTWSPTISKETTTAGPKTTTLSLSTNPSELASVMPMKPLIWNNQMTTLKQSQKSTAPTWLALLMIFMLLSRNYLSLLQDASTNSNSKLIIHSTFLDKATEENMPQPSDKRSLEKPRTTKVPLLD